MVSENADGTYSPSDEYRKRTHIDSYAKYEEMYKRSIEKPEEFWAEQADNLDWYSKDWKKVFDWNKKECTFTWFKGGKLNASYNCLDRHVENGLKNTAAIIFEADEPGNEKIYTYGLLLSEVEKFANVLKSKGIRKGDRVAVYLPMIPELAITMLACARIGAVHSVVFSAFSTDSLFNRVKDSEAKVLVTADGSYRGGKAHDLKGKVNEMLERDTSVESVIVVNRTGKDVVMEEGRDSWWDDEMSRAGLKCPCEEMDAEDPFFLLYTSGSTGKPKGVQIGRASCRERV